MSSETEPLIESNNPFYNELLNANNNNNNKKSRKYSYKTIIFFIVLLIATGVLIYEIYPRNNDGLSSSLPSHSSQYKFIRAEQGHQHAAHIPKSWAEKEECSEDHAFVLTLALKQQNTENLHEHVAAVSHPRNRDTFHKYWSAEDVRSYFKPSTEALDDVISWLTDNGFTKDNGKLDMVSQYGNVIRISLTCGQANKLLNAQYMFYENSKNGNRHLRVKDGIYNVPDFIHKHIDFMSPTIRFPLERHTLKVETMSNKQLNLFVKSHTRDSDNSMKKYNHNNNNDNDDDEESDDETTETISANTPSVIKGLYDMDSVMDEILGDATTSSLDSSKCRQAIASFIEQYYSDSDLKLFWEELDVSPTSDMERLPKNQPQGYGSEAELDTQYITSTGAGIYTYVYYINSDDIFVSLAEAILDTDTPPLVVSISYGADEYELGKDWVERCNAEFGKLALIGTTVLASSGDSGIRGNDDDCLNGDATTIYQDDDDEEENRRHLLSKQRGSSNSMTSRRTSSTYTFIASFPASAPYVTAVGGTTGGEEQDSVSDSTGERAWLYSGGGFSIYFDQPEWQESAVSDYLENNEDTLPDSDRYDSSGRAYPDISAQSVDYVIAYDGSFYLVSGTSASSPTVAGMISMINYARISDGKESLGFLNPSLYSLYDDNNDYYFNDVTDGYNLGCECDNDVGFHAADGWDPITGVGTPKFSRIYRALLELD